MVQSYVAELINDVSTLHLVGTGNLKPVQVLCRDVVQ